MHLNDRARAVLKGLEHDHLKRHLSPTAPDGSGVLDLFSNDYLGLSKHPDIIQSGVAAAEQFGAGATGSRLLSGNLACFETLENQVAQFKHSPAALVFCSGYQANAAALSALMSKPLMPETPLVFCDRLNHASLHHACQRAGIKQIRFQHNDLDHLAKCLAKHLHSTAPKWIVTESVFGMDGDLCPVEDLAELALNHNANVFLDEAHATGVFGPQGRGLGAIQSPAIAALQEQGRWVVMGTFSKAVGVSGAYIACSEPVKQYLINKCTGFVYSTAPSPFVAGAVSKALELIPHLDTERRQLLDNAANTRTRLHQLGLDTGPSASQIIPIIVESSGQALSLQSHLATHNMLVSAIRPPTVPPNTARIRMALNTEVTSAQLIELTQHIEQWKAL